MADGAAWRGAVRRPWCLRAATEARRGPRLPSGESSAWHCSAVGEGSAAPFISPPGPARAAILWCGRHFAQPQGRRGRGGAGDRARAASGSEGGRVPFVLRLWARGSARAVPRPAPDTRRVRAACEPLESSERRARSPEFFLLSKPLKSGIAHPHPCSVKGIDFTRQCSELERGKL